MNRIVIAMVGLIAVGLAVYGLRAVWNRPPPAWSTDEARMSAAPAPNFALKDYDGNAVTLSQFAGRPVVVNAWAAWCPFCREELKDFAAVQEEFGNRVIIIAIDRAEPLETAQRYTDELGVTGKMIFLLDPSDSFYQSIGGFSMPETIFVDAAGQIVFHKRGPMKVEEIRERIRQTFDL